MPTVAASPNQAPGALFGSGSLEQGETEVGERNRAPVVARGSKGGLGLGFYRASRGVEGARMRALTPGVKAA